MINEYRLLFNVVCLILCASGRCEDIPYNDKLMLEVYYESKCADSRKFVLDQLVPAMDLLKDYLVLRFVPFGKATSKPDGFVCQHGPAECLGNVVQDCALHSRPHSTDLQRLAYVACEMDTEAGAGGSLQCVERAGYPVGKVRECVTSSLGRKLQLDSEYLTKLVRPQFIPTVTANGVFDQQFQDLSQFGLVETLCSLLQHARPCSQFYNQMALEHILYSPYSFPASSKTTRSSQI